MVNTSNGPNSSEENESDNTRERSQKSGISLNQLYKEFIAQEKNTAFIDSVYAGKYSESELKKKISQIADTNGMKDFDQDRVSLSVLRQNKDMLTEKVNLNNKRTDVQKQSAAGYGISAGVFSKKVFKEIEKFEVDELENLLSSPSELKEILEKKLGTVREVNVQNFLDTFNFSKKFEKLDKDLQQELTSSIMNWQEGDINSLRFQDIFSTSIVAIFSADIFSQKEKQEIIQTFIPYISLSRAQEVNLITAKEIDSFLQKEYCKGLSKSEVKTVLPVLKNRLQDIQISTKDISLNSEKKLESFANKIGFKEIAKNLQVFDHAVNNEDPKTYKKLIEQLGRLEKFGTENAQKFREGNICELRKGEGNNAQSSYFQIVRTKSSIKPYEYLTLQEVGRNGKYYSENEKRTPQSYKYGEFFRGMKSSDIQKISVHDDIAFQKKIRSGEIEEDKNTANFKTTQDIEVRKKRNRTELIQRLRNEGRIGKNDIVSDKDAEKWFEKIGKEEKEKYQDLFNHENISESANYDTLLAKIDGLDSKGAKFGLDVGTTFVVGKHYYTITKIPKTLEGEIEIIHQGGSTESTNSWGEFFEAYKNTRAKRVSKVKDTSELSADIIDDDMSAWKDFEVKNGKIKNKEREKEKYAYDFLVSGSEKDTFNGDHNLMKIEGFSGGNAKVRFGKTKFEKDDKKGEKTSYMTGSDIHTIPLGVLAALIKKAGLNPKSIEQENTVEKPDIEGVERKGKWASRFFNSLSLTDIIAGGKMLVENIEANLKEGNDEKAARFASKFPLPKDMKSDMIVRIENAERKRMDDYIERLNVLDSKKATEMVEQWLLDKNSPEAKKEAALFFMIGKYGVLYEKKALTQHKGKFLWYEAFGGRIGDDLFGKTKQQALDGGIQFTEEDLMHRLLTKQCRGLGTVKRRGKLYKEYYGKINAGRNEEIEKGKQDCGAKRTFEGREHFALDELQDGADPIVLGAYEKMIEKGADGNISSLNKVPFVMLMSGSADSLHESLADKFKGQSLVLTQFFASKPGFIKTYYDTVLELSKDIERELGGKYIGMTEEAQKIRDKKTLPDRIKASVKFFDEYGDVLSRSMLQLNTRKTDKEARFETWIARNQDKSIYQSYQEIFKGAVESAESLFDNTELLEDAYSSKHGRGGISGLDVYTVTQKHLKTGTSGYGLRNQKTGEMFWAEIRDQIHVVKHIDMPRVEQEERIFDIIANFMDAIGETYASNESGIQRILDNPSQMFYSEFKKWGVLAKDFNYRGDRGFRDPNNAAGRKVIKRYVDNIMMSGGYSSNVGHSIERNIGSGVDLDGVIHGARNAANDAVNGDNSEARDTRGAVDDTLSRAA